MTAIQRFTLHGTIMNPHSSGPYVRHEDHLAAMQGRCLAQIEEPAKPARIVLDDNWKARMLDGRAPERDEMGLGDHPELPWLDEGMMPRSFFAALGLELAHTSAEDQLDGDVLGAMSEAVNWSRWMPTAPQGDGWKLVSIFDTEDGPVAWWLRELPEAEDGTTTIRNLKADVEKLEARIARLSRAGAAPAAVAPQDVVAWMHPETLNVISAAHKHDMSTEYGAETRRKAESHSVALVRAGEPAVAAPALEAPPAVAPQGEYPHEQMDAMALARYKVVPSHASMLWSHAVVAGDGAQQLYVGREVECQNMARKFAGAFLDGAFAFHSMAAAPTAQAAPALEAPAAPAVPLKATPEMRAAFRHAYRKGAYREREIWSNRVDYALDQMLAAAPQAPDCTRCSGSGEDPEGYLTHGHGPDDHTVDGPCRECDGSGAAPQAPAAPSDLPWRTGIPQWTDDRAVRVIAVTAHDCFNGVRVHDIRASDFHTDGDGDGAEVARVCTHWAYRDDIWPRADAAAPAAPAVDADPMAEFLRDTGPAIVWPKARDVGRIGDMSPSAHLRIGLDSDNDVYASIWDERGGATIEFCTPGQGGGKSSRTRMALLAVMVAMEADNAADPGRDWWAERNHAAQAAAKGEHDQ